MTATRPCWDFAVPWRASASTTNMFSRKVPTNSICWSGSSKLLIDALQGNAVIPPLRARRGGQLSSAVVAADPHRLLDRAWPEPLVEASDAADSRGRRRTAGARSNPAADRDRGRDRQRGAPAVRRKPLSPLGCGAVAARPGDGRRVSRGAAFRSVAFRPLGDRSSVDILIAGCGTGEHSIGTARRYHGAKVLAIDLSLSSLELRATQDPRARSAEYRIRAGRYPGARIDRPIVRCHRRERRAASSVRSSGRVASVARAAASGRADARRIVQRARPSRYCRGPPVYRRAWI